MAKLFGLTVESIQTSASFGGTGRSEMRVGLALDPADGDSPSWPAGGSPVSLTYGLLNFTGIFHQFGETKDVGGFPKYSATISDPSEVLNSATLVTELYNGPALVTNIINIYGYYENLLGFGGAEANDIGMTWDKISYALDDIINNPAGTYGGPIDFKGYEYGLDLSEMPTIPADYRVSSNGGSLLDLLITVCRDAGHDPFFIIDGANIKVKTVNRNDAIDPDALVDWISSGPLTGIVSRSSIGLEIRNEPTSALLVGGQKSSMYVATNYATYWGDDISGNPIIGTTLVHTDFPDEFCQEFTIPAFEVADILGDTTYTSNTIELRCVLASESTWHQYIAKYKPAIDTLFKGIFGGNNAEKNVKIDRINAKRPGLLAAVDDTRRLNSHLMYHYLLKYAEEFYGKKFLVQIPTVSQYGPTAAIPNKIYSHEVDQAGYVDGGGAAIGLDALDSVKFESGDGRLYSFSTLPNASTVDAGGLDPQNMSIVDNVIYTRTNVGTRIIQNSGISCVVVSFDKPFLERKALLGGAVGLEINNAGVDAKRLGAFGNAPLTVYPNYVSPTNFGIPLRSNTEVYGPWYAQGAPGKVQYQQDSSLVPWAFNSISVLDDVANARVSTMASSQPVNNSGEIVLAGLPLFSLGDIPQSGGPPIASIDVRYGVSGFITTYQFAAFTVPNRYTYAREMQVAAQNSRLLSLDNRRKLVRQEAKRQLVQQAVADAQNARQFRKNLENWIKRESPHEAFVGQVYRDTDNGELRIGVATATQEEALALSNADDDNWYKNTAVMGLPGLLCPFESIDNSTETTGLVPKSILRSSDINSYKNGNGGIFANDYFPFTPPHPTEGLTWGNAYTNYNSRQNRLEAISPLQSATGVRAIGLRGPLYLTGFGQGINYVSTGGTFPTGGGSKMDVSSYKSGPIDNIWDDWRGVWTSHDIYTATARHPMKINNGVSFENVPLASMSGDTGRNFYVYSNSAIPSGMEIVAHYVANRPNGTSANTASFMATRAQAGIWFSNLATTTGNLTNKNLSDLVVLDEDYGITSVNTGTSSTTFTTGGTTFQWFSPGTERTLIRGKAATTGTMGMVDTGTQSFAGNKTFINNVNITGALTVNGYGTFNGGFTANTPSNFTRNTGLGAEEICLIGGNTGYISPITGKAVISSFTDGVVFFGGDGGLTDVCAIDGHGLQMYGYSSAIRINTAYGGIGAAYAVLGNNLRLPSSFASALPSGSIIDKWPIYAPDGTTVLGYVPIYDM